jgi:hypothetical protein
MIKTEYEMLKTGYYDKNGVPPVKKGVPPVKKGVPS